MAKVNFLLLMAFVISEFTNAQGIKNEISYGEIKVGEKIPEIEFKGLSNYPKSKVKLSDFNSKIIILDFWTTNCTSCIEAFPRMANLELKYRGKLQVILVNFQSDKIVNSFLKKREAITGQPVRSPMFNNDTIFHSLFKHSAVPHEIWIKDGIVKAITGINEVNDKNIELVLNDHPVILDAQSLDIITDGTNFPQGSKPLFVNGNGGNGQSIKYYSILSGYLGNAFSSTTYGSTDHITIINYPIKSLYQIAYNDDGWFIPNVRTILELKDSTPYIGKVNSLSDSSKLFCYQLIVPNTSYKELYSMMRNDLDRYFRLNAHVKKKRMLCYVLTSLDSSLIQTKGGYETASIKNYSIILRNAPLSFLIREIQSSISFYFYSQYPVVDKTGYLGNVDIDVNADVTNPKELDRVLFEKYKMHFELKECDADLLVIGDDGK